MDSAKAIAARIRKSVSSIPPWLVYASGPVKRPSWKMNTRMPVAAAAVSAFISSVLIGKITEPVSSHSTSAVTMTRIARATGASVAAIDAPWSAKSAADPPTRTAAGAGSARTAVTARCPAAEIGSAGLASLISQVPGELGRRAGLADPGEAAQADGVAGQSGLGRRRRGRDDKNGVRVAGRREVAGNGVRDDPRALAGGQDGRVDAAPAHVQRRERDHQQQHGGAGGHQGGTAHHAVGQPVPAAGLGGRLDPADPPAEQHQQRWDDEQGAGGRDERDDRAAEAHRDQEPLREDGQAGQGGRYRDRAEQDRPARRSQRHPQRALRAGVALKFLTEAPDQEQAVVDGEPEPEPDHQVQGEDGAAAAPR